MTGNRLFVLNDQYADGKERNQSEEEETFLQKDSNNVSVNVNVDSHRESVENVDSDIDTKNLDRGRWSNKVQFFLAIMGYTVGIGSVWRFPIICRLVSVIHFILCNMCVILYLFGIQF